MNETLQQVVVVVAIALAAFHMLRRARQTWRAFHDTKAAGCHGCAGCSTQKTQVVTIDVGRPFLVAKDSK